MIGSRALKYARALADVAAEQKLEERVLSGLLDFEGLLESCPELLEVFTNPAIPFSRKRGIVEKVAEKSGLLPIVVNLVLLLLEKARIQQFNQVVEAYEKVLDERKGIVSAQVFSAGEVDESVCRRLQESISNWTGKLVKLNWYRDGSLIGGLKMQIGSTVFDGSIKTQLEEIRRRLAAE